MTTRIFEGMEYNQIEIREDTLSGYIVELTLDREAVGHFGKLNQADAVDFVQRLMTAPMADSFANLFADGFVDGKR